MVSVKGKILHRDEAADVTGDVKPVMTDYSTAVIYEGGVVLPIHYDVLHVCIGIWHARYRGSL